MTVEISEHHKREAKEHVNFLFDKRFLNDELSRESIDWLEEYMAFLFQSKSDMAVKSAVLLANMRERAKDRP